MEQLESVLTETTLPTGEASLLAAREIVKHLDGLDTLSLPFAYGTEDGVKWMDYDELVGLIESIIRHYFGLEPREE
jgi:hypothetical protein